VIRQSINCDICGAEKKQTNHWFVTYTQAGELRISTWNASKNLRPRAASKHLCGQTCLTKLVDEFVAGVLANRGQTNVAAVVDLEPPIAASNASLTSSAAYARPAPVSSAMPISSARPKPVMPAAVVAIAPMSSLTEARPLPPATVVDDLPNYASRHWHTEAWERERERERRSSAATRRKSS
jgi:hypothetical protein